MSETIVWTAADGQVLELTSTTGEVAAAYGLEGRFMPPTELRAVNNLVSAGAQLVLARHGVRELAMPLEVSTASPETFRQALRDLAATFDATKGDGVITATGPDATSRQIVCRYAGGLEPREDWAAFNANWVTVVAVFRAQDPYWTDTEDTESVYAIGDLGLWLPFPPITVVAGDVIASPTVVNDGDVEAWPVWTITGPSTSVTLTNTTTSRSLEVSQPLTAGQTLTIDTRPGAKTVLDQDGASAFALLDAVNDDLFPLAVGSNVIDIQLEGATLDSSVQLAYKRRWLSA